MSATVWHYDGVNAVRRTCEMAVEGELFRLTDGDGLINQTYRFADLVARDTVGGDTIYGLKDNAGWRIGFTGGVPQEIAAHVPRGYRYGKLIDRFGLWPSIGVSILLAAGAVTFFLMTPAMVARAVPPSVERQLGDLMVGDLGGRTCQGGQGAQALSALVQRIDDGDRMIDVRVVNLPIVNAVTLPGGRIVLFDGLLHAAKSSDEVAGVLAHEIGHVHGRDVMESLLRQLGLSVLLGGLDGNIGGYTNTLLASSYSRGAEARADGFAIKMLDTASVSPLGIAAFFERLEGKQPGDIRVRRTMNYLSSHPVSSDRAEAFTKSAKDHKGAYRPALDPEQWRSLQAICTTDKSVEKPEFRF